VPRSCAACGVWARAPVDEVLARGEEVGPDELQPDRLGRHSLVVQRLQRRVHLGTRVGGLVLAVSVVLAVGVSVASG